MDVESSRALLGRGGVANAPVVPSPSVESSRAFAVFSHSSVSSRVTTVEYLRATRVEREGEESRKRVE